MSANSSVQLTFTLRTAPTVRTVHLVGSWDNYRSQLPLTVVAPSSTTKPGSWRGTFRFQGSSSLKLGSRYWYYYIVDGYHVSHDPAKEHVTEKTTGRKLNVLDVPAASKPRAARPELSVNTKVATVAVGRALSPTRIVAPRPQKPHASRGLRQADYEVSPVDELELKFAGTTLSDRGYTSSPSELSALSSASSGTVFSDDSDSESESDCSDSEDERTSKVSALVRAKYLEQERIKNGIKTAPVSSRGRTAVVERRRR